MAALMPERLQRSGCRYRCNILLHPECQSIPTIRYPILQPPLDQTEILQESGSIPSEKTLVNGIQGVSGGGGLQTRYIGHDKLGEGSWPISQLDELSQFGSEEARCSICSLSRLYYLKNVFPPKVQIFSKTFFRYLKIETIFFAIPNRWRGKGGSRTQVKGSWRFY